MPPVINVAMLERAFKKMDEDGNGTLDRNEIKQLMQIMEPRRGITNEELDEAMVEIDTSGDGLVDFEEFKAYWEKNINEGGGVLAGVMTRAGSLCQTSSDGRSTRSRRTARRSTPWWASGASTSRWRRRLRSTCWPRTFRI